MNYLISVKAGHKGPTAADEYSDRIRVELGHTVGIV